MWLIPGSQPSTCPSSGICPYMRANTSRTQTPSTARSPRRPRETEPESGQHQQHYRHVATDHDPDRRELKPRAGELENRTVDVGQQELGQPVGGNVSGPEERAGVGGHVGVPEVVEPGDDQRCRQQDPDHGAGTGLDGQRPSARALQAADSPGKPEHGQDRAYIGDLGKPGVEGQRAGHRDQAPAAPAILERRAVGELDAEQQQRQEGDRVDRGM